MGILTGVLGTSHLQCVHVREAVLSGVWSVSLILEEAVVLVLDHIFSGDTPSDMPHLRAVSGGLKWGRHLTDKAPFLQTRR